MTENNLYIKNCPICGTKPYTRIEGTMSGIADFVIRCNNPNCRIVKHHYVDMKDGSFFDVLKHMCDATDDWNKRTE